LAIVVSEEKKEIKRSKRRRVILNAARSLLEKGYTISRCARSQSSRTWVRAPSTSILKTRKKYTATLSEEVFDLILAGIRRASEAAGTPRAKLAGLRALLEFRRRHKSYYDFLDYFIAAPFVIFLLP
jgi:hypothetical protein